LAEALLGGGLRNGTATLTGARRVVESAAGEQAVVFKLHNHDQVMLVATVTGAGERRRPQSL
jgi:hypothetical protein